MEKCKHSKRTGPGVYKFTLDGFSHFYGAGFDLVITGVQLKVALGLKKHDFFVSKYNLKCSLAIHLH